MTAYVLSTTVSVSVTAGNSATPRTYALSPTSSEIKITQIYYSMVNIGTTDNAFLPVFGYAPTMYRYSGGSVSGGTAVTPIGLRAGAAAPATTARWGTGISISGTQTLLYYPLPITGSTSNQAAVTYSFPSDCIVSPGSVLSFETGNIFGTGSGGATISGTVQVQIYFEELRLSWHT